MMNGYKLEFGQDEPTIAAAVFFSLGAASTAWHEDGVFNDQLALAIGAELIEFIEAYYAPLATEADRFAEFAEEEI